MKKPLQHVYDYLALCVLFSASILSLIYFNGVTTPQFLTVIFTAVSYILWGYIHHKKEDSYNSKVLLEYIMYSILGSILIIGLI